MTTETSLVVETDEAWLTLASAATTVLNQLGNDESKRQYQMALEVFLRWMWREQLTPLTLTRPHMVEYRAYLLSGYVSLKTGKGIKRATAAKMIASVRSMLSEWSYTTGRANPAAGLKPIRLANQSTHIALSKRRVHELLAAIDRSTLIGLRDYALVLLMVRTGIRRAEASALNIGDIQVKDGHRVIVIEHGKEDKQRIIKIQADIFKALQAYMEAAHLGDLPEEPLFVHITKGNHVKLVPVAKDNEELTVVRLGHKGIEHIIKGLGLSIGETRLTPHGLRATSITRKLAAGAPIEKVAVESGHAHIQTTQRYNLESRDLEHTASDYVHDLA